MTETPAEMPWLSQAEIDDLCEPLTQHAAQIRFMSGLGLTVRTKPSGAPLVIRSHFEAVMNPAVKSKPEGKREPNREALIASFASPRKAKSGT